MIKRWFSWAAVTLLALLCAVVAVLQYRWIGEISGAERQRLQDQLRDELASFRSAFSDEIRSSAAALQTTAPEVERLGREGAYAARYREWKASNRPLFRRIAIAVPHDSALELELLDQAVGRFSPAPWPENWAALRARVESHLAEGPGPPPGHGLGEPSRPSRPWQDGDAPHRSRNREFAPNRAAQPPQSGVFELPRFSRAPHSRPGEQDWLMVEPDLEYLRAVLLPELMRRYLGRSGRIDYDAVVTAPQGLIFQSGNAAAQHIAETVDASTPLWESPGRPGPPMGGALDWTLSVRHKAGSLEALVEQARRRNLALSAGLLLLIVATVAALVRFSRQAQRLAELQIHFVAGVSHELRTPLTVIRTAAYNLRGRLAERPASVERYGQLIEGESRKLEALIEQVLQFASARAGHAIRRLEPVRVEDVIEKALETSALARRQAGVELQKEIPGDLPPVLADGLALRHALQNLIDNALKYGAAGGKWIGISAAARPHASVPSVEICVADRGPGIPADEQPHIFDPFFRGRRAVNDQIHGTGLGLDLVKKIAHAHGGSVQLRSAAGKSTEFVLRIPAA